MSKFEEIRVGVIGATGYIGSPYRREIRDCVGSKIVALGGRRLDLLDRAAAEDDAELATVDWREVIDHPGVNFVIVATPDALHHEAVMACARAGKHVLCEKPVGIDTSEVREMRDAYASLVPKRAHFVPYWTRYVEVFAKAREVFESGRIGEIKGVIYRWFNPRPAAMPFTWRDDAKLSAAGSIADVGSHAYDTIRWVLGWDAVRVLAHAETITPPKPDMGDVNLGEALDLGCFEQPKGSTNHRKGTTCDYANIAWQYSNGSVGTLALSHATFFRKGLAPELELHGTEASLSVNRITGDLSLVGPDQVPEILATVPDTGFGNRFEKHVFPVIRAIASANDHVPEHPNLDDGLAVQQFVDAAARSAREESWIEIGNH